MPASSACRTTLRRGRGSSPGLRCRSPRSFAILLWFDAGADICKMLWKPCQRVSYSTPISYRLGGPDWSLVSRGSLVSRLASRSAPASSSACSGRLRRSDTGPHWPVQLQRMWRATSCIPTRLDRLAEMVLTLYRAAIPDDYLAVKPGSEAGPDRLRGASPGPPQARQRRSSHRLDRAIGRCPRVAQERSTPTSGNRWDSQEVRCVPQGCNIHADYSLSREKHNQNSSVAFEDLPNWD